MPRYNFQWSNVPAEVLAELAAATNPPNSDIAEGLKRKYGARPKVDFVAEMWPVLRDCWLSGDGRARRAVVQACRARGLGDLEVDVSTDDGLTQYLLGLRNAKSLREVVIEEFWCLGEPTQAVEPTMPPAAPRSSADADADANADVIDASESPFPAITPPRPWADLDASSPIDDPRQPELILDSIVASLMMDADWMTRDGNTVRWWGAPVPLTITVDKPRECLGDPTVKITCHVDILRDVTADENAILELVSLRNTVSSTGATTWLPQQRCIAAHLTHYSYPGNEHVDQLLPAFALLMYTEALGLIQQGTLNDALGGTAAFEPHPSSGMRPDADELIGVTDEQVIPAGAEPNAWAGQELAAIPGRFEQLGLLSTGDDNGITAEFPYTSCLPAAVALGLGREPTGQTAMAQVLALAHPSYGQGLLGLLHLPTGTDVEQTRRIANDLNLAERLEHTGVPAWGAWTVQGDRNTVTHARFIPNAYRRPGLATTLAMYDYLRSQWAQERLLPPQVVDDVRAGLR